MPITNFTPFTADRSVLAGGMALAQGIGGGLSSLGEGIAKMLEEKKQKASLATSLRKTLSVAYPDRKDEFATLGLEDLQGTLKGEALKSALAEQQSMRLDEALRQQERRMKIAEALAQQRVPQELQAGFESAGRGIPAPLGNEQFDAEMNTRTGLPPAVRELIAAHAQAGAGLPAAVLDDIIRQGAGGANVDWESIKPREMTTGTGEHVLYGKGGQFQFSPSTEKPVVPKVVVGQNPLTGEPQVTWTGSPEDFATQFPGAQLPNAGKAAGARSAPLPLPKDKKELKKGQAYQTSRGVATWNGTAFEQ